MEIQEVKQNEVGAAPIAEPEQQANPEPCEIISRASLTPTPEDKEQHARSLSDQDLLSTVEGTFREWRENIPYIREARDRFAQPGRRVPVPGNPTWTEWVERHLGVGIRRVQQLLAEPKEVNGGKASKRGKGGKTDNQPFSMVLPGLAADEQSKLVKGIRAIGDDKKAARLFYETVTRKPDLEQVRALLHRCLEGQPSAKQLEALEDLQKWIVGQILDLKAKPERKHVAFMDDDEDQAPVKQSANQPDPPDGAAKDDKPVPNRYYVTPRKRDGWHDWVVKDHKDGSIYDVHEDEHKALAQCAELIGTSQPATILLAMEARAEQGVVESHVA